MSFESRSHLLSAQAGKPLARSGVRYPSPFFDIGSNYLPPTMKSLFRWCRYFFYTSPTINAGVSKMAAYPITDLHYDTDSVQLQRTWDELFSRILNLRSFLYGVGLDYWGYGNAFIGIHFPFRKNLICPSCGGLSWVKEVTYRFRDYKFVGECPKCRAKNQTFATYDWYYRSANEIRLLRFNPEDIDVEYAPNSGKSRILYTLPTQLRNDIHLGRRHIIEECPDIYLRAMKENKPLKLDKVFHFRRETLSQDEVNMPWGIPLIFPALKLLYLQQIFFKAQECIAQEHIVPWRYIYPQPNSGAMDPYNAVHGGDWRDIMMEEFNKWRQDPNHVSISGVAIGQGSFGGDGRALMITQDMRLIEEDIMTSMQIPMEFLRGGVSYGQGNLATHQLKNSIETYRGFMQKLVIYLVEEISNFLGWTPIRTRFKRHHMPDDLQRAGLSFQLNQATKISDQTLLAELNYDAEEEEQIMARESTRRMDSMGAQQIEQARAQGEAMLLQGRYQAKSMKEQQDAQTQMQEEAASQGQPAPAQEVVPSPAPNTQPQPPAANRERVALGIARKLSKLPEDQMYANLQQLMPYPELHRLVMQFLPAMRGQQQNSAELPLPEQRAPRRGPGEYIGG